MIKLANKITKERKIAYKIKTLLNRRGFVVNIKYSKKTKSVYLEIDNGACNGIRISNHKNKKSRFKYNVIRNYNGKKIELENGMTKNFYDFKNIGRLITDIELERSNRIINFGYQGYKRSRDKNYNYSIAYEFKKVA